MSAMQLLPQFIERLRSRRESPPARVPARVITPGPRSDWPAHAERRLTYKLLNYWDSLRGTRPFPAPADIDGRAIPELWPWCFIIDTEHSFPSHYFLYLGKDLAEYSGIYLSGEHDWRMTLLDKAAAHLDCTLTRREPTIIEDELTRYDGRQLLFRCIMLPLSDDGETINQVLGAANGRLK